MYGIEKWEPLAPRWENHRLTTLQNFKNHCSEFSSVPKGDRWSPELEEFLNSKIVHFVYDSNRFEEAGVNEKATKEIWNRILKHEKIPNPSKEEQETINHFLAYKHAITTLPSQGLSMSLVCQLHEVLMNGIDESAGQLREKTACAGMDTQYPDPELVPIFLEKVLSTFNNIDKNSDLSPFAKAAWLKCRFVEVHPFEDGNGRLSRILMNWVLYKYNYLFPVAIASDGHKQAKKHYMQSLKKAVSGKNQGNISYLLLRSMYNSIKEFQQSTKTESNCVWLYDTENDKSYQSLATSLPKDDLGLTLCAYS